MRNEREREREGGLRERERLEYIEEGVETLEDYGLDVICCLRDQTSGEAFGKL